MFLNIAMYLFFTVGGLIFMKMGAEKTSIHINHLIVNITVNIYIIIGLILYTMSFGMWTILLKKYDLTYIVPITTSISYVAVLISGLLLFNEKISLLNSVAILIILVGVVLLNVSK